MTSATVVRAAALAEALELDAQADPRAQLRAALQNAAALDEAERLTGIPVAAIRRQALIDLLQLARRLSLRPIAPRAVIL